MITVSIERPHPDTFTISTTIGRCKYSVTVHLEQDHERQWSLSFEAGDMTEFIKRIGDEGLKAYRDLTGR
jgi:hypothetical protein